MQDVNDNPPVFSQPQYFNSVSENATLGELVLIVSATDTDTGIFGEVSYRFQSPISKLSICYTLCSILCLLNGYLVNVCRGYARGCYLHEDLFLIVLLFTFSQT